MRGEFGDAAQIVRRSTTIGSRPDPGPGYRRRPRTIVCRGTRWIRSAFCTVQRVLLRISYLEDKLADDPLVIDIERRAGYTELAERARRHFVLQEFEANRSLAVARD